MRRIPSGINRHKARGRDIIVGNEGAPHTEAATKLSGGTFVWVRPSPILSGT